VTFGPSDPGSNGSELFQIAQGHGAKKHPEHSEPAQETGRTCPPMPFHRKGKGIPVERKGQATATA